VIKKIRIGDEDWAIRSAGRDVIGERLGLCDRETKTIWIYSAEEHADPVALFGTLAHEIIHARNPRLSEKATSETEAALMEIARALFG
jgi:hypothetical protein